MNATASLRRRPEAEPQPVSETPEAEFFRHHPDRFHRIRLATPGEIKVVQAEEARVLVSVTTVDLRHLEVLAP